MRAGLFSTFIFSALVFFLQPAYCQPVDSIKISGTIVADDGSPLPAVPVTLLPMKEGWQSYSSKVSADGVFNFSVPANETALYDLRYAGYAKSFLLSSIEPTLTFRITIVKGEVKRIEISGSRENTARAKLKQENDALKELLAGMAAACSRNPKSSLGEWKKEVIKHNDIVTSIEQEYKGTLTADVMAPLAKLPQIADSPPLMGQMQQHFFDSADLTAQRIFNSFDFSNKLSAYLNYIADTSAPARYAFIQMLFDKTNGNMKARKELANFLFSVFTGDVLEPYIQSFVQWASSQPGLASEQPVLASKLKRVAAVLPGMTAPEVMGNDTSGNLQTLSAFAKNNRLTLLIFWESECSHCRKSMPEFLRLYAKYRDKGLNVFAVSLDTNKDNWKKFVASNHLVWTNIILPDKSSAHTDYFIQYTPTMVLLDSNSIILRRYIDVGDLDENINRILGK